MPSHHTAETSAHAWASCTILPVAYAMMESHRGTEAKHQAGRTAGGRCHIPTTIAVTAIVMHGVKVNAFMDNTIKLHGDHWPAHGASRAHCDIRWMLGLLPPRV